jgi:hypothetical protein
MMVMVHGPNSPLDFATFVNISPADDQQDGRS